MVLTVSAVVLSRPLPAAAQAPADTSLKQEQLGDGIYLFRAPSTLDVWTATNVVVIVNDQDVTVFDSNTRPTTARMVIGEIRKLTNKPVRTLINSHWHMDHWSGNDEYVKAFPGIQIIATTQSRDYMKRMGAPFFANEINPAVARERAALDSMIRTGKQGDGSKFTAEARRKREADVRHDESAAKEISATPRVVPNVAFRDTLILWSGPREFRLFSAMGDATESAVLYLPREKILVTGDVLVSPESGEGEPPWTTNSYAITPWLASLRSFQALDASVIVPGQGPAMHDKTYLALTADLYAAVIAQVHAALESGRATLESVQASVNVDSIGRLYPPHTGTLSPDFHQWVGSLTKKVLQESVDGALR